MIDVTRPDGDIKKCLDEYYDSFLVSDQLRKCLLMREFEEYDTFSSQDRQEFIFHLFKALCLGGRLCQVFIDNYSGKLNHFMLGELTFYLLTLISLI